jgi:hypothetical protein
MINFGNVPAGSVLPIPFASYAASTGASATLSGLAVTDIEVYKGTSMTQRASDNGYALIDTDGIDIDGITGINGFSIDTGDNSDAGFYAVGSFFTVVVSAVTIDSQTVNFIAATFRLVAAENTAGLPAVDAARIAGAVQTAGNIGELANRLATMIEAAAGSPNEFRFTADALVRAAAVLGLTAGNLDAQLASLSGRLPALVGGLVPVDVVAISGDATAANNLETALDDTAGAVPWLGIVDQGQAQSATSTTLRLRAAAAFANDELVGATVVITGGSAGVGQARTITDYDSSTDTATVDAWTTAPSGTILYKVFASPPPDSTAASILTIARKLDTMLEAASGSPGDWQYSADALRRAPTGSGGGAGLDAAGVRAAVGLASANLDTQLAPIQTGGVLALVLAKLGSMVEGAPGSPGEYRFNEDALELAPAGGGGGGGTDWSAGEREQIRHRLGIDGSATAPSATPSLATAAALAAVAGNVTTTLAGVSLVKASTDALATMLEPATGSPGDYRLSADALRRIIAVMPTAVENADALLARDIGSGTNAGSSEERTVRSALRILRNKWSISGSTQTITKEDDTTAAWTQVLGTTPGADPVTSTDPT